MRTALQLASEALARGSTLVLTRLERSVHDQTHRTRKLIETVVVFGPQIHEAHEKTPEIWHTLSSEDAEHLARLPNVADRRSEIWSEDQIHQVASV